MPNKKQKNLTQKKRSKQSLKLKYMIVNGGNGKYDVYKLTKTKKNFKGGLFYTPTTTEYITDKANEAIEYSGNAVYSTGQNIGNAIKYSGDSFVNNVGAPVTDFFRSKLQ